MELVGREGALARLDALLTERGGALLVRGPRGYGRSALLDAFARRVEGTVLRASGSHRLLRDDIACGQPLDRFRASLAVLDRLRAAAPVVVLIDDADRLDPPSLEILAFVARRTAGTRITLVAAATEDLGFEALALEPLGERDAAALLARTAPGLPTPLAATILDVAGGMPLAIVELARAAVEAGDDLIAFPAVELPVTPRLAEVLGAEVERFAPRTQTALLAAALDPQASLDEVLAVADGALADVSPAIADGVVTVAAGRLRFTRPLLRVGVMTVLGPRRVQAVHTAFAERLAPGTTRQVLHRAAAAVEPDAELSAALCAAATELRARGDVAGAAAALETAADLSVGVEDRIARLVSASLLAFELGLPLAVRRLLDRAERLGPAAETRPLIEWQWRRLAGAWPPADDAESARLIAALVATPDADAALTALMPLAMSDPSPEIRRVLHDSARRIARCSTDPRVDAIAALTDPTAAEPDVRHKLAGLTPADPLAALHLAIAAEAVGAWREAHRLLGPAVEQLRRRGPAGALALALAHQALAALYTGDWTFALTVVTESHTRAGELIAARAAALVASDEIAAEAIARAGLGGADAHLRAARAAIASADGDPERTYDELIPLFRDTPHVTVRTGWEIFDLVEAAVALRRSDEAAQLLDAFRRVALGPLAETAVRCAAPLVAPSAARFAEALAQEESAWPFLRARTLLALGGWRHRTRRPATTPLRIARDELAMLGATRYVERARRELRAAGSDAHAGLGGLTPHELRIARLAASGLTNAQIAARLRVSSRTIGSHLYVIFPKLGITSRRQLQEVL